MIISMLRSLAAVLSFFIITSSMIVSAYADDIEDSINEALEYYKEGSYSDAIASLEYASQLIKQNKAEDMTAYLPAPLDGWKAEQANSQAAGAGMFGGGVSVERRYSKGASSVSIQIITDSPMMQGVMMMFSNPMFASSEGGKLEKVGKQKAIVKYDPSDKSGDIKLVIASKFFIMIEGRNVEKKDLKAYAEGINYDKLESMQ